MMNAVRGGLPIADPIRSEEVLSSLRERVTEAQAGAYKAVLTIGERHDGAIAISWAGPPGFAWPIGVLEMAAAQIKSAAVGSPARSTAPEAPKPPDALVK